MLGGGVRPVLFSSVTVLGLLSIEGEANFGVSGRLIYARERVRTFRGCFASGLRLSRVVSRAPLLRHHLSCSNVLNKFK